MSNKAFYQHYADRLAALIEGPEGYDMGEDKRDQAIFALIRTLPETSFGVKGFPRGFADYVFDRQYMLDVFSGEDPDEVMESIEDQARNHWEMRSDHMTQAGEKATMLMHFAKDLSSDAVKKAQELFKESAEIAKNIGLTISDHKLEVLIPDPSNAYDFKKRCQNQANENRDDYVTIDVRLRQNRELDDRFKNTSTVRVDIYGSKPELLEMMAFILSEEVEYEIAMDPPKATEPRVPGYIDGESYRTREFLKREMNKEASPSMSV